MNRVRHGRRRRGLVRGAERRRFRAGRRELRAASSFGGLVETPVLDQFAATGLRYTNMHTTALCSPSRACILTGRNHHSVGMATIAETSSGYPGYNSILPFDMGMLSEMLLPHGYNTFMVGKWHLSPPEHETRRVLTTAGRWPAASSGSTGSWVMTPISGIRNSSTTTIPLSSLLSLRTAIT